MAATKFRLASGWLLAAGLAGCTSLAGCTVSFHPMGIGKTQNDHFSAEWYSQNAPPGGPHPGVAGPPGRAPMVLPNVSPQELSLMLQKVSAIEDDRKSLAGKLQQVEVQLREKDQAVVQATYEIQESTKQIKRTRDEMQSWKQDMDEMRTKLRQVEREHRQTLETVVKTLESYLDREKESGPRR